MTLDASPLIESPLAARHPAPSLAAPLAGRHPVPLTACHPAPPLAAPPRSTRTRTPSNQPARARARTPSIHPLEHIAAFRAVISAAPVVAELARTIGEPEMVTRLTLVCADLAQGFAVPQGSRARHDAHRRAWTAVREIDRNIIAARIHRRAPAKLLKRAQRAIDRADVLISSLPGVLAD